MSIIGTVESLWRYPVKSMRGEELRQVFVGFGGLAGDRRFAFHSTAAPPGFPYFTAREQNEMLRYVPRISPDDSLEVTAPSGQRFAIGDPALIAELRARVDAKHNVSLVHSQRALADAHPVSLLSVQTARALAAESGTAPEKRRFRANIYADLTGEPFGEDSLVGQRIRIGPELIVSVIKRDGRCMMINLDPDTSASTPSVLKAVAQRHGGYAGVYGDVVREGTVRVGAAIEVLSVATA